MRLAYAFALIALASGCNKNPYFSDDEGATRPSAGLGEHPDELSLPYALGTQVGIGVKQLDSGEAASWTVVSDTPGVVSVDKIDRAADGITAQVTAHAEGEAVIHLKDGAGGEQRSATLSVRAPDHAKLYAHGPLRILGDDQSAFPGAEVSELRMVAGGTAVYAVAYFRGDQRVWGRGLCSAQANAQASFQDSTTSGAPSNEFLEVTALQPGAATMNMTVAGQTMATLPVAVVQETDLVAPSLVEEVGDKKDDGQKVWVLAEWNDQAGHAVEGVYAGWTLDGAAQVGKDDATKTTGDLYRYEYDPNGAARTLTATRGALTASRQVRAHDGWVYDTTYLGCSVGGRASPWPFAARALARALAHSRRRA